QLAHFPADWFSSDRLSSSRDPTPVQPKAGPMPANHGLRSNEDQRPLPARPNSSQNDPEQPVDRTQSRARSLCVQSQQLLPKGEVLQEEFFSGAKDGDDPAEHILDGAQTSGDHSEERAVRVRLEVIDSADVQSFGEGQPRRVGIS